MHLGCFSISLSVKDLAASRAFYEKLGFEAFHDASEHNYMLAIDEQATAEVRDAALLHLERLGERITSPPAGGEDGAYEAHRRRAAREIDRYLRLGEVPALRTGVIQIPLPWP